MADFKKLRLQNPEERAAERARFVALHDAQDRKIEDIQALEQSPDEPLNAWEQRFARNVVGIYRMMGYLSDAQWEKVDEILDAQEDRE